MQLITPSFWQKRGLWAQILRPVSCLYAGSLRIYRALSRPRKVSVPVICIGNLTVGGSGKTPVALAFADYVVDYLKKKAVFLTRGYGGTQVDPLLVDPLRHSVAEVGDEALLLAQRAPTWVARNRLKGAMAAIQNGASVLIMDDGFQHFTLYQDIKCIVVDGAYGFGNGYVLPAGPLREKPETRLQHADALIIIGEDHHQIGQRFGQDKPIFYADVTADFLPKGRLVGFAGIGYPQKFYDFLKKQGCTVVDFQPFPDHYLYSHADLCLLQEKAKTLDASLVTTAKDFVRLPADFKPCVQVCTIKVIFKEVSSLHQFLKEKLDTCLVNLRF
jgi:tetraacyldisaccharide 4'-kinase